MPKSIPNDPWGNAYSYQLDSGDNPYVLKSLGADGDEGGDDENADVSYF